MSDRSSQFLVTAPVRSTGWMPARTSQIRMVLHKQFFLPDLTRRPPFPGIVPSLSIVSQRPLLAFIPKVLPLEAQRVERGALAAVSMSGNGSWWSGCVSSEASLGFGSPPLASISSEQGAGEATTSQGAGSGRSSRSPLGIMAFSSGGGSTCLAWNGSDGRNS